MMRRRPADQRGHFDHGWLDTHHSFSFGHYHDPEHMGFRDLRVINDDIIQPSRGFGTHGHRDMEIITYVLDGALEHKDSTGGGSVLRPGDVQRMTAGHGVTHSEFNHSPEEALRLLQIWILPRENGLEPGYEEKHFPADERQGRFRLIAAPEGSPDALTIHQDVQVFAALLKAGDTVGHELAPGRHAWLQVAKGRVQVAGQGGQATLDEGDGLAISDETTIELEGLEDSEVLLFDLK